MTVIVFDLDDTLYDELTYVRSGFQAVAVHLQDGQGIDSSKSFEWMWQRLQTHGRGQIFDDVLKQFNCYSKKAAKKCLGTYRMHMPDILLDPEADECIARLQRFPLYIVTDGNKIVQHRKLTALGLYDRIKFCYITHRFGVEHAKPSPYCFLKIAERENESPGHIIYVGDNPQKDFIGIKKLGFRTVRIMRGQHKDIRKSEDHEAEYRIGSLTELNESFLREMTQ